MGLFSSKKEGGLMDVIRCDREDYLVWKWSPGDMPSKRENAIRYGSRLRVQYGEAAVFVYDQKGGCPDIIKGSYDDILKTANFPILASIAGLAWGGNAPFQAEVYFINLAGVIQVNIFIDSLSLADKSFSNQTTIPVRDVKATVTFAISDCMEFLNKHRLRNLGLSEFRDKIKATVTQEIKSRMSKICAENNISVLHIDTKLGEINDLLGSRLASVIKDIYGVELQRCDIFDYHIDKDSEEYKDLYRRAGEVSDTQVKNLKDTQRINAENMEETLRVQREEMQRAQKLQTETNFMGAHALNQQTDVMKTAAESLGQMGSMGDGSLGGGMNPAGMMAGMMMGGAVGGQMAGMMNTMGQGMKQSVYNQTDTPPPPPVIQYMALINGQQSGPFNPEQLRPLIAGNVIGENTYVWKQGMSNWEMIRNVGELSSLLQPSPANVPPPPPPPPPPGEIINS
ncbi:MAG: SPFH domain-containing protein [Tannerella sp.]|jgi:membrane protease subunit (stomatin/prohibitin family)|nr:SPFH domain-containing protein [Tannerella sp.]